jgi:hypothetical protein
MFCLTPAAAYRHVSYANRQGWRRPSAQGSATAPGGGVATALRPFLAVRVLGVIPLTQMSGPHAVMCLAKVAELAAPALNLPEWCAVVIQPNRFPQSGPTIATGGSGL